MHWELREHKMTSLLDRVSYADHFKRYTPLPPALYWGPKSPEACAKWVKDLYWMLHGQARRQEADAKAASEQPTQPQVRGDAEQASVGLWQLREPPG